MRSTSQGGVWRPGLYLPEGDLQFMQRIVARLVDPGMLAGRADEQAGEEIGERRMVEPVA